MGLGGLSRSQASKLRRETCERVGVLLARASEGERPCLWLDATCLELCEGGRIVSVAPPVAVAANRDGRREIEGLPIGPSEAEACLGRPSSRASRGAARGA